MLLLLLGGALLATFVWWQTWSSGPLVPAGLFRDRDRAGSLLALLLVGASTPTVFLILVLYLQGALRDSPFSTGLAVLPMAGAVLVAALVSGPLQARLAARHLIVPGLVLAALGVGLLARLEADSSYAALVLPALLLLGLGLGLALGPLLATATGANGPRGSGGTAGTVLAAQTVGAGLAVPLFGNVLASMISGSLEQGSDMPPLVAEAIRSGVLIDPYNLPASLAGAVERANAAVLDGYSVILWSVTGLLALAALLSGLLVTKRPTEQAR